MTVRTKTTISTLIVLVSTLACEVFGPNSAVEITLPEVPEELAAVWPELVFTVYGNGEKIARAAPSTIILEVIPSGGPVAMQAFPVDRSGRRVLPPAGALFDAARDGGAVELSWDIGVASEIGARLNRAGMPLDALNRDRLVYEIEERAGRRQWDIDIGTVVGAIVNDSMHVRYLEPSDGVGAQFRVPPGTWVRADALRPEVEDVPYGILIIPDLSAGSHRWRTLDGTATLRVSVSAAGDLGYQVEIR